MNLSVEPSPVVLKYFELECCADLSGRLNRHWLVTRKHEPLVLRRCYQAIESIQYEIRLLNSVAALGYPVAVILEEPIQFAGFFWTLTVFLEGKPASASDSILE